MARTRSFVKYVRTVQGAATRSMLLTPLATVLGGWAFAAIAMEGGNLKIELPNGPNGLLWPAFILWVAVVALLCVYKAVGISKGDPIEPERSGKSEEDFLRPAPIVTETRRSETEVITTRRDESVSSADRRLAEGGEPKPTDLLKRQGGAPDPALVADAGRNQGQDKSRGPSSQQGGDRRSDSPLKPAATPATPQPAAPSATASATVSVTGDGAKKSSVDA